MLADLRADHEIIDQDKNTMAFQQAIAFSTDLKQLFATNSSSTQESLKPIPANHRKDNNFKKIFKLGFIMFAKESLHFIFTQTFLSHKLLVQKSSVILYTHKPKIISV